MTQRPQTTKRWRARSRSTIAATTSTTIRRIADVEYDQLYKQLQAIEAAHPDWIVDWSPTQARRAAT